VRVDVEFVGVEKFIEDDSTRWQPVIRIVLVVVIAELISGDAFAAEFVVFAFEISKLKF